MKKLDLDPKYMLILNDILHQYVPDMEIWAYGSRVNGDNHKASDLDLVIRNPEDLSRKQDNLGALRKAFHDSNLPIKVQVQDWARIPDSFRQEIEKEFMVIIL